MKKWLLVLVCTLPSLAAAEPIDPNPDGIGIYADLEGCVNRVHLDAGVAMEVYVLVTRPSGGGPEESLFSGAEFRVVMPPNVDLWGWNVPHPGALVATTTPDFMIALRDHVPYEDVIHVLTLIVAPLDNRPARFYLTAIESPSLPGELCYSDSYGFKLFPLTPYPGGCDNQVFVINGEIVSEEEVTWGDVKSLYR